MRRESNLAKESKWKPGTEVNYTWFAFWSHRYWTQSNPFWYHLQLLLNSVIIFTF